MKKSMTSILILLMILGVENIFSQSASNPLRPGQKKNVIYFGPVAGYNRSFHTTDYKVTEPENDAVACPSFTEGSNNGYFFGISGEYLIGNVKNSRSSIIGKIVYNTLPSTLSQGGGDELSSSILDPTTGAPTVLKTSVDHSLDIEYNLISTEIIYKFNFKGNFGVTVGPVIDLVMSSNNTQRMTIVGTDKEQAIFYDYTRRDDPDIIAAGITFEDGGRTRVVDRNFGADISNFRMGLKFGLQYTFYLQQLIVVPNFNYNFGLTNLSTVRDWRVSAIQVGVDVRWAFKY